MKKRFLISSILISSVMISCNVGASVVSPGVFSNLGNKVKLNKDDYNHRQKEKTAKVEKDSKPVKFFKKLEAQEESKRATSKLPIFAKYRKVEHDYAELCVKKSHHILINKKRARAACKAHYS